MDIELFQTFQDVSRQGSFAAVARDSNTDPSVISRQVATLESYFGYKLFDRTTRRLSLTEAGQLTLERIRAPLNELLEVRQYVSDTVASPQGRLCVTSSIAFAERWLIPRIASFESQYPDIKLELALSDKNVDLISEGIDLAIRLGSTPDGSYVSQRLFDTSYRIVASPAYLEKFDQYKHPNDLSAHRCIVFRLPGYQSLWKYRRGDKPFASVEVKESLVISNALAIRQAAIEGLGVAMLSDWTIEEDIRNGMLVDLFPEYEFTAENFDTSVWALHLSRDYVPVKIQVFIRHMMK